ncbi:MAG: hypothetical protein K5870_07135 [Lachnospiraceae bacterium]|nr:hypothetical protein [Lachnospiraceae bacterium]
MAERTIPFDELMHKVIDQLKKKGYMDSTLNNYRRLYNRINVFINQRGTDLYTKEAGRDYLDSINVCRSTFVFYNCTVRRLDDYLDGKSYRCHHGNPSDKVVGAMPTSWMDIFMNAVQKETPLQPLPQKKRPVQHS